MVESERWYFSSEAREDASTCVVESEGVRDTRTKQNQIIITPMVGDSVEDDHLNNSTSSKRLRPSPFEDQVGDTDVEGNGLSASPPPSTSGTTDTSDPIVTVAMLRALTREMLKTYGS